MNAITFHLMASFLKQDVHGMTDSKITLKACPFCGGRAELAEDNNSELYAACASGNCKINPVTDSYDDEGEKAAEDKMSNPQTTKRRWRDTLRSPFFWPPFFNALMLWDV